MLHDRGRVLAGAAIAARQVMQGAEAVLREIPQMRDAGGVPLGHHEGREGSRSIDMDWLTGWRLGPGADPRSLVALALGTLALAVMIRWAFFNDRLGEGEQSAVRGAWRISRHALALTVALPVIAAVDEAFQLGLRHAVQVELGQGLAVAIRSGWVSAEVAAWLRGPGWELAVLGGLINIAIAPFLWIGATRLERRARRLWVDAHWHALTPAERQRYL